MIWKYFVFTGYLPVSENITMNSDNIAIIIVHFE